MARRKHRKDNKALRPHIERLVHDIFANPDMELSRDRVNSLRLALRALEVLHKLEDNADVREPQQLALDLDIPTEQLTAIRLRGAALKDAPS